MEAVENIENVIAEDNTLLQNIKFEKVVEHKSWLKIIADAYENDNINDEWDIYIYIYININIHTITHK